MNYCSNQLKLGYIAWQYQELTQLIHLRPLWMCGDDEVDDNVDVDWRQ